MFPNEIVGYFIVSWKIKDNYKIKCQQLLFMLHKGREQQYEIHA